MSNDTCSVIKKMKEDCQELDEAKAALEKRILELKTLKDEKKKKEAKVQELIALEKELLASL
jgi:hypothetical protein